MLCQMVGLQDIALPRLCVACHSSVQTWAPSIVHRACNMNAIPVPFIIIVLVRQGTGGNVF